MSAQPLPSGRSSRSSRKPIDTLTDDDIQAMSEGEYMNEVQLAFFRRKLEALREETLQHAGGPASLVREEQLVVPDPVDRATAEEQNALERDARDRNEAFLEKIEQALARIESGDYGFCEETGEQIGVPRMLARPTANLSLHAQERRELRQKTSGV